MWKKLLAAGLAGMVMTFGAADIARAEESTQPQQKIVINLAARSLALIRDNAKFRLYPIGPGKASTPTPTGYYKILEKEVNPTWTSPSSGVSIASGPDNPLGYRWMQFYGNYGIHGTNRPDSIGHYVSNGCVRMHEKDAEALYDLVSVGTPVEITYNRVVVEKTPDDQIAYYIYPDGYGWQSLDVDEVNKWLAGYGMAGFVSDEDIEKKIEASDGEPTYIAKVYQLKVNGKAQQHKAIVQGDIIYFPAIDLAEATGTQLGWNAEKGMLYSNNGKAQGYDKKDILYCDSQGLAPLYHLQETLNNNVYELTTIPYSDAGTNSASTEKTADASTQTDNASTHKSMQAIFNEATKDGRTVTGTDKTSDSASASDKQAK